MNELWKKEPNNVEFEAFGFKCEVKRIDSLGHLCGYVVLPEDHKLYGTDYEEIDVDVHGGLTYSENGKVGFDCAHAGDCIPSIIKTLSDLGMSTDHYNGDEYRDMGFVIRETYELARQLSEA